MSLLGRVNTGVIKKPPRILVYGQAGVGKSTWASEWPKPLFIDAERRTEHLDVARIEVDTWDEIMGIMGELSKQAEAGARPYETIIFDTVDHMEHLLFSKLCSDAGVQSIEDVGGGYGKGYTMALVQWRRFINGLEYMRNRGLTCILLAHGQVKQFQNPEGENYDRWQLKMNAKAADYLREKMDLVGFASYEDRVTKRSASDKAKATSAGERVIKFSHSPAYESKPGLNVAPKVKMTYEAFADVVPKKDS